MQADLPQMFGQRVGMDMIVKHGFDLNNVEVKYFVDRLRIKAAS